MRCFDPQLFAQKRDELQYIYYIYIYIWHRDRLLPFSSKQQQHYIAHVYIFIMDNNEHIPVWLSS